MSIVMRRHGHAHFKRQRGIMIIKTRGNVCKAKKSFVKDRYQHLGARPGFRKHSSFLYQEQKNHVNHIPCQSGLGYIGQKKRALKFRVKEDTRYVTKQEISKSAIAAHSWNFGHS